MDESSASYVAMHDSAVEARQGHLEPDKSRCKHADEEEELLRVALLQELWIEEVVK